MGHDQNELDRDQKIDPNQLDIEVTQQAELFSKWARRSVEAKRAVERAALKLKITTAQLQQRCRLEPKDFGLLKVTEAAIEAGVFVHDDYTQACENLIHSRYVSNLIAEAVKVMEMKRKSIGDLITLHGMAYFAGPSVPRDLGELWLKHQEISETKLNERVKKKTRRRKLKRRKEAE